MKKSSIVEETDSLSISDLEALVSESAYILDLTIIEQMEQEVARFEGGDNWTFEQYAIQVNRQLLPTQDEVSWTNKKLTMPGRKEAEKDFDTLDDDGRYIAFYDYSAMAKGYSLEGLMSWSEEKITAIKNAISD